MPTKASGLTTDVAHDFESAIGEEDASSALVTTQEWDNLLGGSVSDVVFLTWQWQRAWWRHFGANEDCKLHLLTFRDERGTLVGIAPLFIASAPLPPPKEYKQ